MSERHHEILGLTPELSLQLAATILGDDRWHVERIPKPDLAPRAAALCRRDHELRRRLKSGWEASLAPWLDVPETGG